MNYIQGNAALDKNSYVVQADLLLYYEHREKFIQNTA